MINKSSKQTNIWSTYLTKDPDEVGSGVVNQTLPPEKTPTQTRDIYKEEPVCRKCGMEEETVRP
jgi:hypothetical protein